METLKKSRLQAWLVLLGGVLCAVLWAGCLQEPNGKRVWVAIEPVQCLGNSWERDWLERNDGDYAGYPRDRAGQFRVIRGYFEARGVTIYAMASRPYRGSVCLACSCPRGDTLYILVHAGDLETMKKEGFRIERPRMPGPVTRFK